MDPHYDGIQIEIIKIPFYSEINKFSPLPGFEPGTTPVASYRANHWAMTTWCVFLLFVMSVCLSHPV